MKKRIYLTSDYETLIKNDGYYVDKTRFIPLLENYSNPNVFFLRPRRFGKSLLLSVLEHYYGIQYREDFDELFGAYYIGQPDQSTALKNTYHIFRFDFSGIDTENVDNLLSAFNNKVTGSIKIFAANYGFFSETELDSIFNQRTPADILSNFFPSLIFKGFSGKIFILIDEYDHFTNELLSFNIDHFREIVSQNGWVRKFYEVIKQFIGEGLIGRFFATGVTPVTLDSMTSGFNIAKNITTDPVYHNMAGFTEDEVKRLIEAVSGEEPQFDPEKISDDIREWYNGSKFSIDAGERLYNPQMLLNFLNYLFNHGKYPSDMYDPSVSSDYSKIKKQLGILKREESYNVITEIIENERICDELTQQYDFETGLERKDLISLLFYNGLLTMESGEGKLVSFVIPNYVSKIMYWDFIRKLMVEENVAGLGFVELMPILDEMRFEGRVSKLIDYTSAIINTLSNRDLSGFRELNLKSILVTILSFSQIYRINSEFEINRKYVDLLLELQPDYKGKYSFILELKYLKRDESEKYEEIKRNGIEQLQNYLKIENLNKKENMKAWLILFLNDKGEAIEVK